MARTKVVEEEKKKNKKQDRPPGAGKAAKTLMMKKNLENKAEPVKRKAARHRHGVARAMEAARLNKAGGRIFQRAPLVRLVRQIADEIRPETRLSRDFVSQLLVVLENEGLEVTGSARILAAKDRRATARASDLLAALLVSRSGMFESASEVRAHMVRALCDEAVHYCFDPQTGETLIQPWKIKSFTNQERDPLNILRSVEWRVTWPQGLPLNLLIFSVKLSMSSSFLYSPERQRRIVQLFMTTVEQGPLTPVKQRLLMRKIAEVTQDPEGTLPKGYVASLLAFNEDDEDEEERQPKTKATANDQHPPPLAQATQEEDF